MRVVFVEPERRVAKVRPRAAVAEEAAGAAEFLECFAFMQDVGFSGRIAIDSVSGFGVGIVRWGQMT